MTADRERDAGAIAGDAIVDAATAGLSTVVASGSLTAAAFAATTAALGRVGFAVMRARIEPFLRGGRRAAPNVTPEQFATDAESDPVIAEAMYAGLRALADAVDPAVSGPLGHLTLEHAYSPRREARHYRALARALAAMSADELAALRAFVAAGLVSPHPEADRAVFKISRRATHLIASLHFWERNRPLSHHKLPVPPAAIAVLRLLGVHNVAERFSSTDGETAVAIEIDALRWLANIIAD